MLPEVTSPVCLRTLKSSRGTGAPPLFCVPAAAEGANWASDLASACGESRPVYAFLQRGLQDGGVPHSAIEAAAKYYLNELRKISPIGPVHLVGHLLGGSVAFEMAVMLHAEGRNELSLTILDTDPPREKSSPGTREYTLTDLVAQCLEMVQLLTGEPTITVADLESETPAAQAQLLLRLLVDCGLLAAGSAVSDLHRFLKTLGMGCRMTHTPRRPFSGDIHLVLSDGDIDSDIARENAARKVEDWKRWTSRVIEHRIAGNRITMLKPPNVRSLAAMLMAQIPMRGVTRQLPANVLV
jgi:arthrofactin-type cyclic lipopeptide synthetase C